ncbi:hypothetical protein NPIL_368901 [Nephila pilipes]|uniref:Uncharacterized protein n=1 Tax=Nephila pilipes TaxID=299642 RepID=A0A8X6NWF7_NEPPI|nr:hypothetical protein NPIL_368901 [Nephila pilipes]
MRTRRLKCERNSPEPWEQSRVAGGRGSLSPAGPLSDRRDYPLNLSILISGGKENNSDSPSSGERTGRSPAPNPCLEQGNVAFGRVGSVDLECAGSSRDQGIFLRGCEARSRAPWFPLGSPASRVAWECSFKTDEGNGWALEVQCRGRFGPVSSASAEASEGAPLTWGRRPRAQEAVQPGCTRPLPEDAAPRSFLWAVRADTRMWTPNFFGCSDLFRPGPQRTVASDSSPPNYVLLVVPVGSRVAVRTLSGRGRWPSSPAPLLFFPFGGRRCCGAVGRCPTRPVLKHGPRSLTCVRVTGSRRTHGRKQIDSFFVVGIPRK